MSGKNEVIVSYKRTKFYDKDYVDNFRCDWSTDNKKFKNLSGKTLGSFKVLKLHKREKPHTFWFCECECGNIQSKSTNQLSHQLQCTECSFKASAKKRMIPVNEVLSLIKEKHPSLELKSYTDNKKDQWLWYCSDCNTPYYHRLDHVSSDYKTCRCNPTKFLRWTKGLREFQIKEECIKRGVKFLGWMTDFENSTSRIIIKCTNHPHYDVTLNNFLHGFGCPYCADERKGLSTKHTLEDFITNARKVHGDKFDYSEYEYICSRTPSRIICTDCNLPFNSSYDNHVNKGRGCPHEKGKTHLYTYLLLIKDNCTPVALKYGKATKYDKRIKEHVDGNRDYNIEVLRVWEYQDTDFCNRAETAVKKLVNHYELSNKDFKTGAQETTSVSNIDLIVKTFEELGGELIEFEK